MIKNVKILLLTISFVIIAAFSSLASTEYTWEGSQRDAERAGGLGWITITEPHVLPGTEYADVLISQSSETPWGKWVGESPADEDHWQFRLYKKDGFSARVQLPYGSYMEAANTPALREEDLKDFDVSLRPMWQYASYNEVFDNIYDCQNDEVMSECTISSDHPEGEIKNALIMTCEDPFTGKFNADISYLFDNSAKPIISETRAQSNEVKKAETEIHYENVEKTREIASPYYKLKVVLLICIGFACLICVILYFKKKNIFFLIPCAVCAILALVVFFAIKSTMIETYIERVPIYSESAEDVQGDSEGSPVTAASSTDNDDSVQKEPETIDFSALEDSDGMVPIEEMPEEEGDAPMEGYFVDTSSLSNEEEALGFRVLTGEPILPYEELMALPVEERQKQLSISIECDEKFTDAFTKYAAENGFDKENYVYRAKEGSLKVKDDVASFVIGRSLLQNQNSDPVCICEVHYDTGEYIIRPFEEAPEEFEEDEILIINAQEQDINDTVPEVNIEY